ncbi:phospholipase ABHD3 [Papilio machaon]|uniref:phospholipase ABHD3 n=1 Tax=Papilio machaon TaxID=76193 RepID=UPI001E6660D5|nr:phospholipase ABHD3 [Papilio machaon]
MFTYILEIKKELLVCVSLSVLYFTYYLVEVVKKPILICRKGEFRELLEQNVPILKEYYWPTPWCVESRLQTVIGSLLRSLLLPPLQFRREVLKLSDGGQVALDWLEEGEAGEAGRECRAVLLVLPGLTGGAQADYVRCLAAAARRLRAALVVFNNRGLGGLPLTTPRLYSAVSHEDVGEAVSAVRARGVPVLAAGVSLGGLQLGRYLAEQGASAPLHAALIVSSPLDVVKGSQCMERGGLNAALSWHMARQLRGTVRARLPAQEERVRGCRSVRAFDAAFTAPHFGFASPEEYYRAASLAPRLARVARPLLCLCAADDPFQPLDALPVREAASSSCVALCVTARGGHIGFLEGWWPARAAHTQYVARVAEQYFAALLPPSAAASAAERATSAAASAAAERATSVTGDEAATDAPLLSQ